MPLLPIALPPGLERNGTPYESTRKWWDMNLMRWVSGSARPLGGWVRKTETPLADAIRRFWTWRNNDNTYGTLVGTETKLYADYGPGWLDITPVDIVPPVTTIVGGYGSGPYGMGTYGTPRPATDAFAPGYAMWSFANWGEDVLLLSSKDNRLFHYISATPDVAPVALAEPPLSNGVGVTEERHVMLVGVTLAGTYYPHRVAWGSRESLTDWDFADVTNSAGYIDLAASSPLTHIVNVREGMLIFSSTEVFLASFIGSPYIYAFTKLAEMPIMHPYTVAVFGGGRAAWMTPGGIHVYAGQAVQMIDCPVWNDVRVDFNPSWFMARSHASANGQYPEVWMFWPSESAVECDRYVIFNYVEGWWGWGYLERSAMVPSGALRRPLAGTKDGTIYEHENGWTDAGLPILDRRFLETGALGIAGGDTVVDIKQAMLATTDKFHDVPQAVKLQFFGRYTPDGNERVFGPYLPRLDGYTDTRVNCREARVRYVGNVDALFDVGLLRLEVSAGGRR